MSAAVHPNALLARRLITAYHNEDGSTMGSVLHPDVVWRVSGAHQLAGEYRGHDQVFGYFARILDLVGGSHAMVIEDVLASDERVFVLVTTTASRPGMQLQVRECLLFHVLDGRLAECWEYSPDQQVADAFWG
jgi:ketosteroid isomerase-like protein